MSNSVLSLIHTAIQELNEEIENHPGRTNCADGPECNQVKIKEQAKKKLSEAGVLYEHASGRLHRVMVP